MSYRRVGSRRYQPPAPKKPKTGLIVGIVVGSIVLVIIIIIVIILLLRRNTATTDTGTGGTDTGTDTGGGTGGGGTGGGGGEDPECEDDTDCSGGTPVCKVSEGICVECLTDINCSGGTPRCDVSDGTCVECLTLADCGGINSTCIDGVCCDLSPPTPGVIVQSTEPTTGELSFEPLYAHSQTYSDPSEIQLQYELYVYNFTTGMFVLIYTSTPEDLDPLTPTAASFLKSTTDQGGYSDTPLLTSEDYQVRYRLFTDCGTTPYTALIPFSTPNVFEVSGFGPPSVSGTTPTDTLGWDWAEPPLVGENIMLFLHKGNDSTLAPNLFDHRGLIFEIVTSGGYGATAGIQFTWQDAGITTGIAGQWTFKFYLFPDGVNYSALTPVITQTFFA